MAAANLDTNALDAKFNDIKATTGTALDATDGGVYTVANADERTLLIIQNTDGTNAENVTIKAPAKPAKPAKKAAVKEVAKPVIKTASKKTKKDLALHELLIQHALQMANLKPNQCRWPIGDPDSDNFHFCGETVFAGKPYCYEHCRQAYQFTPPKKK